MQTEATTRSSTARRRHMPHAPTCDEPPAARSVAERRWRLEWCRTSSHAAIVAIKTTRANARPRQTSRPSSSSCARAHRPVRG
eukprot:5205708-Prymnesium_polylepis.1